MRGKRSSRLRHPHIPPICTEMSIYVVVVGLVSDFVLKWWISPFASKQPLLFNKMFITVQSFQNCHCRLGTSCILWMDLTTLRCLARSYLFTMFQVILSNLAKHLIFPFPWVFMWYECMTLLLITKGVPLPFIWWLFKFQTLPFFKQLWWVYEDCSSFCYCFPLFIPRKVWVGH